MLSLILYHVTRDKNCFVCSQSMSSKMAQLFASEIPLAMSFMVNLSGLKKAKYHANCCLTLLQIVVILCQIKTML